MLRFSLGVTRIDKIRNEYIRGTAQVGRFGEKTREARLRWYGHVLRKDDGYIGRRVLRMELPGKRKRGRPKRRFMDVVKEDIAQVEVTEEDAEDRSNWRWKIRCGDPWWEKAERRRRIEISRIKSKKKRCQTNVEAPAYVRTACYAPAISVYCSYRTYIQCLVGCSAEPPSVSCQFFYYDKNQDSREPTILH